MKIKPGDSRELSKSSETETEVSTGTILIDQDYHIIYYNEYAKKILRVMMQLSIARSGIFLDRRLHFRRNRTAKNRFIMKYRDGKSLSL